MAKGKKTLCQIIGAIAYPDIINKACIYYWSAKNPRIRDNDISPHGSLPTLLDIMTPTNQKPSQYCHVVDCWFKKKITCKNVHAYIEIDCVWPKIEVVSFKFLSINWWLSSSNHFYPLLHCTRWNIAMKARCVVGFFILVALSMLYVIKGEQSCRVVTEKGHWLYLAYYDQQPIC